MCGLRRTIWLPHRPTSGLEGGGSDVDQRHRGAIIHGVRAGVVDGSRDEVREQLQDAVAGITGRTASASAAISSGVQCVGWVSVTRAGARPGCR
jgi:hypothetical protein